METAKRKYDINMMAGSFEDGFMVEVTAVCKESGRTSDITTLNHTMSELGTGQGTLTASKTAQVIYDFRDFVTNPELEKRLAEDRAEGEWENFA